MRGPPRRRAHEKTESKARSLATTRGGPSPRRGPSWLLAPAGALASFSAVQLQARDSLREPVRRLTRARVLSEVETPEVETPEVEPAQKGAVRQGTL